MTANIELLAEHPDAIPQLGRWMYDEWPRSGQSPADCAAVYFLCLNRNRLPLALIARDGGEPVGTVSLLQHSVTSHDHLRPWVAALYVAPAWRHRGLATALVDEAAAVARRLGVRTLYIGVAFRARTHYERLGWHHLGVGRVEDDPDECVDVLRKGLVPGDF